MYWYLTTKSNHNWLHKVCSKNYLIIHNHNIKQLDRKLWYNKTYNELFFKNIYKPMNCLAKKIEILDP